MCIRDSPYYNDFVIPTGNLREPKSGIKRAQIIIISKCPPELEINKREEIIKKIAPLSHQIVGDKLVVSSIENPNPSHDFIQNAQVWELDLTTLPDGKHNIILNADGKESLAVYWTGPNADLPSPLLEKGV